MKLKKAAAVILACSMLIGQTVWAQEIEEKVGTEEVQELQESGDAVEVQDVQEETLQTDNVDNIEEQWQEDEIKEISSTDLDNAEVNAVSLNLYQGYDLIKSVSRDAGEISISDESVCNIELIKDKEYIYYLKFHALKPGKVYVEIKDYLENVIEAYNITVDVLPKDAAPITDIVLRSRMMFDSSLDADKDGYISKAELAEETYMGFSDGYLGFSIKALSGLEYAVNLRTLHLSGNKELTNIDALFQLKNLEFINIVNTGVSDEDRWKLANFGDIECSKGEMASIPRSNLFTEGFSIREIENDGIVETESSNYHGSIRGLKVGKAKLEITYKNFSKEIMVTVNGIDYNQEVGNTYTGKVELFEGWQFDEVEEMGQRGVAILKENGELWLTYPEPRKVRDNVKQCLLDSMLGTKNVMYILDKDNILWNDERKLAENVIRFDGFYVLDEQKNLKNFHTGEVTENVKEWVMGADSTEKIYILKENGELYVRRGEQTKEAVSFEKVKNDVITITSTQFLCKDGAVYEYKDTQTPVMTGVKEFLDQGAYYYDMNGSVYVRDGLEYANLGKLNVKDIGYTMCAYGGDYSGTTILILTEENDIYAYKKDVGLSKIDSDVKLLSGSTRWVYQKLNGELYDIEGKQGKKVDVSRDKPIAIYTIYGTDVYDGSSYSLRYTATEEDYIVVKEWYNWDEVEILNHVDRIWRDRGTVYALRTDGTIWDISGVPKMILDLATNTYVPGDVNEDGIVNIEDLRIILRGVCGKIDLTEHQVQIADVEADGKVDIQDLRKVLRYVCGKITQL